MKKLRYKVDINAPKRDVYNKMISPETYKTWTAEFNPTSEFEGSWEKGGKIKFVGTDENGKKGGMVSEIAENIPGEFISIHHYGILDGDNEITSGPEVEKWAPAYENYTFEENNGLTTVTAEIDTNEEYEEYFNKTWPKAFARLKEICES
jgi:hypothetical protein